MEMSCVRWLPILIAAIGLHAPITEAEVIVNTFGPGDAFPVDGGSTIYSGQWFANQFTVSGGSYWFDQLEIAAGYILGANQFDISIRADDAGVPGARIETFSVSFALPAFIATHISMNSVTNPMLLDGGVYWVVLGPGAGDSYGFWPRSSIYGPLAWGENDTYTTTMTGQGNVYRVSGTLVPEPSQLLLVLAGIGVLAGRWKHHRNRPTQ